MERLTDEQKNFRDAMQILIDLYYLVKEIDDNALVHNDGTAPITLKNRQLIKINKHSLFIKDDPFFIQPVIILLARLFHKTIPNFSPCKFFSNPPFFHYRKASEVICFEKPTGKSHPFQEFIELIDALKRGLDSPGLLRISKVTREYYPYKKSKSLVPRSEYEIVVNCGPKYRGPHKEIGKHVDESEYPWIYVADLKKNEHKSSSAIDDSIWMNYDDTGGYTRKITHVKEDVNCRIVPMTTTISDYTSEAILKDVNAPPPYYEVFRFTCAPVIISNLFSPSEVVSSTVSSPGHLKEKTNFFDVIKYILVKYVSLFGSFERIKVCKKCSKLFLEKKYGYGIFCNDLCRIKYDVGLEPKDIFNCRARQNAWLERKLLTMRDTVLKDDCKICKNEPTGEKIPKGGKCQIMLDKNIIALNKIVKVK